MKKNLRIIIFVIGLIALAGLSFTVGVLYGQRTASAPSGTQDFSSGQTKIYTNALSHYSLIQPPSLPIIEEQNGTATFKANQDEPWMITVTAEKTSLASTDAWLRSQPKGSPTKEGISPLLLVNEKAILTEYVAVDQAGGAPVLKKTINAALVKNGSLYRIQFHHQYSVDETPSLDERFLGVVMSFKAL